MSEGYNVRLRARYPVIEHARQQTALEVASITTRKVAAKYQKSYVNIMVIWLVLGR